MPQPICSVRIADEVRRETLFPVEQVIGICPDVVSSDKTAEQIPVVVVRIVREDCSRKFRGYSVIVIKSIACQNSVLCVARSVAAVIVSI